MIVQPPCAGQPCISARALRPFSGSVLGRWACKEAAAPAACMHRAACMAEFSVLARKRLVAVPASRVKYSRGGTSEGASPVLGRRLPYVCHRLVRPFSISLNLIPGCGSSHHFFLLFRPVVFGRRIRGRRSCVTVDQLGGGRGFRSYGTPPHGTARQSFSPWEVSTPRPRHLTASRVDMTSSGRC